MPPPTDLTQIPAENDSNLKVTWTAPSTDNLFNPEQQLQYQVYINDVEHGSPISSLYYEFEETEFNGSTKVKVYSVSEEGMGL